uniref:Calcium-transporting ATPase 3 endoplasmic reticulum-type isoform X4 n=1 Tax=Rhizophora mucronata TaxID=61149 RepID=A0A2P2M3J3_RHIMU
MHINLEFSMAKQIFTEIIIRIVQIRRKASHLTKGSKNAVKPVSPLAKAKMKETRADAINILTSKSSNCFKTSFQKGVPALSKIWIHEISHTCDQSNMPGIIFERFIMKYCKIEYSR